jgi:hypothetical protein
MKMASQGEEHKLQISGSKVLRNIFGPVSDVLLKNNFVIANLSILCRISLYVHQPVIYVDDILFCDAITNIVPTYKGVYVRITFKGTNFCDVTPCSPIKIHPNFRWNTLPPFPKWSGVLTKDRVGDQVKEDEIGRVCRTYVFCEDLDWIYLD